MLQINFLNGKKLDSLSLSLIKSTYEPPPPFKTNKHY